MADNVAQLKLEELPVSPGAPELVVTAASPTTGLDLLGLRLPAEGVANSLLDGVTTITPNVRYLSLRAWIIHRYQQLKGLDGRKEFLAFAHKVEAAVVFGNLLNDPSTPGLAGPDKGGTAIRAPGDRLELVPLVKIPAVQLYAGPSEALKIGWSGARVPGITVERGVPLANAVDETFQASPVPMSIAADGRPQDFSREELKEFGRAFAMRSPDGHEREALRSFILPANPTGNEVARVATYCLILHLTHVAQREIKEADVFAAALAPRLEAIPAELHETCEGWARFAVRDMLVAVHEAAVGLVGTHIVETSGERKRRPRQAVLSELTSPELERGFLAFGFSAAVAGSPIKALCDEMTLRLGETRRTGNIHRWDGGLSELDIIGKMKPTIPGMSALPVAWLLAVTRMQPGIRDEVPGFDLVGQRAAARFGIRDVILPEVQAWPNDDRPVRDVVAQLIARSVEQHQRIALSRLAREQWKDVSVLASDGDEWLHCQGINNGRAQSRLYQAISWARQLGLTNGTGLTQDGQEVLETRLAELARLKGGGQ